MNKLVRVGVAAMVAATVSGGVAGASMPAFASGGGGGVRALGTCTGTSVSSLKAKADDGKIEVEFEVDSNVAGQTWNVAMRDNGTVFFKGSAVTSGTSGSFTIRRRIANQAGSDLIQARAKNVGNGETCTAQVAF
jgi:hypothetical protein